jgi:hypothetical protein
MYGIRIVKDKLTEKQSFLLEVKLIKIIGRVNLKTGPLSNCTDGGEGTVNKIFTRAYREKLSIASSNQKRSKRINKQVSLSLIENAKNNPNFGFTGRKHKNKSKKKASNSCLNFHKKHKRLYTHGRKYIHILK